MSYALEEFVQERWGNARRVSWSGETQLVFESCPSCGRSDKFSVNPKKGLAYCYSCQFGRSTNVYQLLADWEGISVGDLREGIRKKVWLIDDSDFFTEDLPKVDSKVTKPTINWERDFLSPFGKKGIVPVVYRYLTKKRGLTDEVIERFQIRVGSSHSKAPWHWYGKRACIPYFSEDGEIEYFIGRAVSDNAIPRYRNSKKGWLPKSASEVVFNLDIACQWDPVVLCEGCFDVFSVGKSAAGLGGKRISAAQANLLHKRGVRKVIAFFDSDVSMEEKKDLDRVLREYFKKVFWIDPKMLDKYGVKDPGGLQGREEEMQSILKKAKPLRLEDMYQSKFNFTSGKRPPWE